MRKQHNIKFAAIFPYDLLNLRPDWLQWINFFDYPCVYSKYGYEMLKKHVKNLRFIRHVSPLFETLRPLTKEERKKVREQFYGTIPEDGFLFGFIGQNQFRKNPHKILKAYSMVKEKLPDSYLYMHTEMNGVYNLKQYAIDCGIKTGTVLFKNPAMQIKNEAMIFIYNGLNCLVNASMQEGLSLTPLEAMLCGVPVIATRTTAQTELLDGVAPMVEVTEESTLPLITGGGLAMVDTLSPKTSDIADAMYQVATDAELRNDMIEKGYKRVAEWLQEVSDINELLNIISTDIPKAVVVKPKQKKILFAQHSSGGDVLMTTQCFKNIKERHKNMPLVYMTQTQYQDIITGNKYIDEIIDWNPEKVKEYEIVYNPHGEKILPGGWNNGDVKLYAMYPYFCKVDADEIYIECVDPQIPLPSEYIVVNVAGQSEYRYYKHMALALRNYALPYVQLGSLDDPACAGAIDMRGKLSWRQSAWVMKHAKAAVVIDSFCSHLAGAVGTPAVVLFGPAPARVTGPRNDKNNMIFLQPNMLDVCPITSNCWGNLPKGKNKCMSPCINTINPIKVREAIESLMK